MAKGLKQVALYTLVGFVALVALVLLVGVAIAWLSTRGVPVDTDQVTLWLASVIAVVAMVGAMAITVGWMRSIDEAAREAHKSAWFWGGCGGMGVGGVFFILASLPQAADIRIPGWFSGRADPVAYAATGAAGLSLLMLAGYTLAWAWWWWKRR